MSCGKWVDLPFLGSVLDMQGLKFSKNCLKGGVNLVKIRLMSSKDFLNLFTKFSIGFIACGHGSLDALIPLI